ncbi:MAG TPA: hypothetical protein VG871_06405, partial [Vicinamibacterales bacterium]|nr:hypothetical protein [Vicinamibacterales bacterium]
RPGVYAVTFTLSGFTTVKREGISLSGSFTAVINADMRVGAVEETVLVTGDAPVVDVQNVTQQRVIGSDLIAAIPTGRSAVDIAILIPGIKSEVSANGNGNPFDVGGVGALSNTYMTLHGSSYLDQRISVDGVQVRNIIGPGNANNFAPNIGTTQEMNVETEAGSVEQFTGGVRVNFVPREGGNVVRGSFFATGANSGLQASNITQALRDQGLASPNALVHQYDINPSVGGPILLSRLWFYTGARWQGNENYLAGMYANVNAGNPAAWTYVPDYSQQAKFSTEDRNVDGRLTWQATPSQKVGAYYLVAHRFWQDARPNFSPEAFTQTHFPKKDLGILSWSSVLTKRLLLEVRGSTFADTQSNAIEPHLTKAVEQSGIYPGLTYRGVDNSRTDQPNIWETQATLTYVTGAHAAKIGISESGGTTTGSSIESSTSITDHLDYRLNNGIPNQLTEIASPYAAMSSIREFGLYAQDKWTIKRLTLNGGLRFDHLGTFFPGQTVGPAVLAPTRNVTFPESDYYDMNDISPRVGMAYDLFGDGKTAVKVSFGKYLAGYGATDGNPVNRLSESTTRTWTDSNHNFIPDCDLTNPLANLECSAMANNKFGTDALTSSAAATTLTGWSKRLYNDEFTASVQRELTRGVAVSVGYIRRWFGNFTVTDNLATAASDYSPFGITAPVDLRLPGGGGYVVSGLYNLNPNKVGQVNNEINFADAYGSQIQHWNGLDVNLSMRLPHDVLVQAGVNSGRTTTDNCAVTAQLPELQTLGYEILSLDRRAVSSGVTNMPFCHTQTPFLTDYKAMGTYTMPRVDVLLSAAFQSFPGPEILANEVVPNAVIAPSLGRSLSGGAPNATVALIAPGTMYGDRASMLDLRIGKILRFGRIKNTVSVDIYNVFNTNTVTQYNNQYGAWLTPTSIVGARLFKFSLQTDF